jgi:hypothetical protein
VVVINAVLGGIWNLESLTHGYTRLRDKHGVKVVYDTAVAIDSAAQKVSLQGGRHSRREQVKSRRVKALLNGVPVPSGDTSLRE